jgi:hypothetical protein
MCNKLLSKIFTKKTSLIKRKLRNDLDVKIQLIIQTQHQWIRMCNIICRKISTFHELKACIRTITLLLIHINGLECTWGVAYWTFTTSEIYEIKSFEVESWTLVIIKITHHIHTNTHKFYFLRCPWEPWYENLLLNFKTMQWKWYLRSSSIN